MADLLTYPRVLGEHVIRLIEDNWKAIYGSRATPPGWRTQMYVKGRFDEVHGLF